jgi:hypothetical protein
MSKKRLILAGLSVLLAVVFLAGCAGMTAKPTDANFQTPVVTLEQMEVAHAFGYYYYSNKVKPTKGNATNAGAPLELLFTFNVENPNDYPVQLEKIAFTIGFEGFDLNTVKSTAAQWIPPGKTNQIAVPAHFDTRQSLLSLLVTGGFKLKEKGWNAWSAMERWWTGIPNYEIPVDVSGGSAIFKADGIVKVASFNATFP